MAVNHLVEVDTTGALIKELNSTNGNPGLVDLVAKGNFIYALSPGNNATKEAVTVFDVSSGQGCEFLFPIIVIVKVVLMEIIQLRREIQNFNPKGVSANAQGMTAFQGMGHERE